MAMLTVPRLRRLRIAGLSVAAALSLSACTIGTPDHDAVQRASSVTSGVASADLSPAAGADNPGVPSDAPADLDMRKHPNQSTGPDSGTAAHDRTPKGDVAALRGAVIFLDPGHAGTPPPADQMVTDGRGGTKQCNTTGTASNAGWPEHTFNWELATRIKSTLEAQGASVLLSREDDTNRAPCIDERAKSENASAADAVISIHADGAGEGARGFHVSSISDPLPGNLPTESAELAADLRDALVARGFQPSNYLGSEGLYPRSDLTGLNLSAKPKALVEFGNMRDSQDIAMLQSEDGQNRMTQAVIDGIVEFLSARR